MKKFATIMIIALVAISTVFAVSFDDIVYSANMGYARVGALNELTVDASASLFLENTKDPNTTSWYTVTAGVSTDFASLVKLNVFTGPSIVYTVDDVYKISVTPGIDSTFFYGFDMGLGLQADAVVKIGEDVNVYVGTRYTRFLKDAGVNAYKIYAGATYSF